MAAVIAFVRDHRVRVILPTGDESVVELASCQERFAELGCTLVVASDAALEVNGVEDLRAAEVQFGYPFVVKPTISWTGDATDRVSPIEVINQAEAMEAITCFVATGCKALAQQWAAAPSAERASARTSPAATWARASPSRPTTAGFELF